MKRLIIILVIFLITLISVNAKSIFLSDYMEEGQTKVYETEDGVYVVNLLVVADEKEKAVFRLNDEMSKGIKLKDSYVFEDGSEIVLRELVINEAEDGNDEAYYYFYGTGKEVLPLKNISMYAIEDLCNFDRQCLNETKENCCYDCGCNEEEECINNRCVEAEEKEEVQEQVKEESEEEVEEEQEKEEVKIEEKKEVTKEDREKKAAYAMLVIIFIFILVIIWFVIKKKRSVF